MLQQIGIVPDLVVPADLDETPLRDELPGPHAARLATAKATLVAALQPDAIILAADTVVACGRRILPKAETPEMVRRCLSLLSGRRHRVYGGVCLMVPGGKSLSRLVRTDVIMKRLSRQELEAYVSSGEGEGKAGGYAIQGRAAALIPWIGGSYSNIVGLPLAETAALLIGAGYKTS